MLKFSVPWKHKPDESLALSDLSAGVSEFLRGECGRDSARFYRLFYTTLDFGLDHYPV